ncbi:MAG: ribbon-helix-helix domain-containing protein [Acidiferrobacteraceae bacterium]
MDSTARWTIKVSRDTDILLRTYLAQHGMKKGDLSKFIERAVQKEILAQTVADVKRGHTDIPPQELEALIDEAVCAVRADLRSEAHRKTKIR